MWRLSGRTCFIYPLTAAGDLASNYSLKTYSASKTCAGTVVATTRPLRNCTLDSANVIYASDYCSGNVPPVCNTSSANESADENLPLLSASELTGLVILCVAIVLASLFSLMHYFGLDKCFMVYQDKQPITKRNTSQYEVM